MNYRQQFDFPCILLYLLKSKKLRHYVPPRANVSVIESLRGRLNRLTVKAKTKQPYASVVADAEQKIVSCGSTVFEVQYSIKKMSAILSCSHSQNCDIFVDNYHIQYVYKCKPFSSY